ncbi:MAG: 2-hydroxy-3-oxopropionate reductase [Pseudomonadota bacterium]
MTSIGFIGLGIMGAPMAGHLLDAGHQVSTVVHRTPAPADLLEKGLEVVGSANAVAEAAEIVITMVPDTPQVAEVLFGADGVAEGLSPGKLIIDMSSIAPMETKNFAARIAELGCGYVDAPVSGGEVGAKNAALTIMCGGSDADFARAKPLFDIMGKNITLVGGVGDGQTCKVANQIIVALNIQAVSEALVFAAKAGADPAKVREALMGGFAASKILEVHAGRMLERTFDPGFRIELHQKDLNLALSGAKALEMALPNTATCQQMMSAAAANGDGQKDHSALVRSIERMAGYSLDSGSD